MRVGESANQVGEQTLSTETLIPGMLWHVAATIDTLAKSFARSLKARQRSPETVRTYLVGIGKLCGWLDAEGLSHDPVEISRRVLEDWIGDMTDEMAPGSVATHYRSVRAFWSWLEMEDEIPTNPFRKMNQPNVPDTPPRVLGSDELRRVLDATKGKDFGSPTRPRHLAGAHRHGSSDLASYSA